MENLSMCRMCLTTDVRLCSIASHLRDMYERITSVTFKRDDRRPLAACYICHARLQNCYRLRTSCLRSEELLTEMMSSGVLKPQDMLSTNTFKVVPVIHLSLGHVLQDSTEYHVKKEPSEVIRDAELEPLYTEDIVTQRAQEEQSGQIDDNYQSSHLEDPIDIKKEEADDVVTDAEYINLEDGNVKIEENGWEPNIIDWEPDIAGPSSQSADNICPKIVKVVLERIDLNGSGFGCFLRSEDLKRRRRATEKISIETTSDKLNRNKEAEAEFGEPGNIGARVSKKPKNDALKDTEDATTQVEIKVENPITASNILETCDKIDINKQYQCNVCKICFKRKDNLNRHIRIHTDEKPFQCNICKKCFIRKDLLKIHINTHTGDKPYQCNICQKCFIKKCQLQTHILTHTSDKPYQCNVCKKGFIKKSILKTHIRTHTGDKPYQCSVCKKRFIRKYRLKIHIRTHTGEKPYQCNVCKKCFSDPSFYSRHILIHKR